MFFKISEYLLGKPKTFLTIINVALVLILGFIDYLAGYEISFSIFYLFPIALVAWFVGKRPAFMVGLLSAIMWFFADYASGKVYSYPAIAFWNTFVRLVFFFINAFLIAEIKKRLEIEKQLSRVDPLTGVANVRSFYEYVNQEKLRVQRYLRPFTLAYIDLDNFKIINDEKGHNVGDELLRKLAQSIKNNIRSIDVVARLGGDEFALLLPEIGLEQAKITIERLRMHLQEVVATFGYSLTFSIGVVTVTGKPPSAKEIIKKADDLMYEAKKAGKNTVKYEVWKGM